ncbi:MAG: hypothetical protein J6Z43_02755 [Clostridiales bacterium]|nr:hypothetical protein [Clostridiales bacterium]
MNITGITFDFTFFTSTMDSTIRFEIPLTGEGDTVTKINRDSGETKVSRYRLSDETRDKLKEFLSRYGIEDWIGVESALPKVFDGEGCMEVCFLYLKSDDGAVHKITFRENDQGKEASVELRKLCFAAAEDDLKISEELLYPTLKECRYIREEHGPVVAVETYFFSCGMMYNSNQTTKQLIEKTGDGLVRVTIRKKAGNLDEVSESRDNIKSDIFERIQEISDRENIPGWEYACIDPNIPVDRSMMPLDYSSSSSLTVMYDDTLITGAPRIRRTIGESACKLGGAEVDKEISELVRDCVGLADIKLDMPGQNLFEMIGSTPATVGVTPSMGPFAGMQQAQMQAMAQTMAQSPSTMGESGEWTCSCGTTGLTAKFCYNCGGPRPQ